MACELVEIREVGEEKVPFFSRFFKGSCLKLRGRKDLIGDGENV